MSEVAGVDAEVKPGKKAEHVKTPKPEAPKVKTRGRARMKEIKEGEAAKMGILTVVSMGLNAAYGIAATQMGPHWHLQPKETAQLATALHAALETLPGETYSELLKYFDKYGPWIVLAWTAGVVTLPRIQQTVANRNAAPINGNPAKTREPEHKERAGNGVAGHAGYGDWTDGQHAGVNFG